MEALEQLLHELIDSNQLLKLILSDPKGNSMSTKITVQPVLLKQNLHYQMAVFQGKQVFHSNVLPKDLIAKLTPNFTAFKQMLIQGKQIDYQVFFNRTGVQILPRKRKEVPSITLEHNRSKQYLIKEGEPVLFFKRLGIMDDQGRVVKAMYHKFRQINRYLEFIEDILGELDTTKTIRILDFGCGKSYLTFATYHYLHEMLHYDVEITGLDLKEDVISFCNEVAKDCEMEKLQFSVGNIEEYQSRDSLDLVISLHACDTATDAALAKAVQWNSKVIMAVPCCHHELNQQIKSTHMAPLLRHGILKERISSLITDAARVEALEICGYKTQILEFIEMEHTPKNLLIRAVKSPASDRSSHQKAFDQLKKEFQFDLAIERLLLSKNPQE